MGTNVSANKNRLNSATSSRLFMPKSHYYALIKHSLLSTVTPGTYPGGYGGAALINAQINHFCSVTLLILFYTEGESEND
ncbi:hypothetical protein M513_13025 [Trichuris suis]|uniref:Uncharacterized protein n=1 Tax=Trichuris suis TaxID=68888 RepID=A0A085LM95_9BILA|nr:hypothetical protein M513_13025 [Trichuris suis]